MLNLTYCRLLRILLIVVLSAVIGTSVLTGAVAAQEYFEAEIVGVNPDPIKAGDDLSVDVKITNTGDKDGSQNITLTDIDGNVQNETREIDVDKDDPPKDVTIVWEDVQENQNPKDLIEPTVKTENATDDENNRAAQDTEGPIEVRWSNYEVQQVEVNRTDLSSGENLKFNATIENTGTYPYRRTVYLNGSTGSYAEFVDIPEGESEVVDFNVISAPSSSGEFTYTVNAKNRITDDDSGTQDVTVSGDFTVESIDGRMDGQNLTIEAELSKLGSHDDTQPVTFSAQSSSVSFSLSKLVTVPGTETSTTFTRNIGQKSFDGSITVTTDRSPPEGRESKLIKINDTINLGSGDFEIRSVNPRRNSIPANGNLTVTAQIENVDNFNATQTVQLINNETGTTIQEKEVLINGKTTETVELYWDPVPSLSERRIRPEIRTENDGQASSNYVTIIAESFEIEELTVNRSSVTTEGGLGFNATVRNLGAVSAGKQIELVGPDGNVLDRGFASIRPKKQSIVSLTTPAETLPGEYQYTVRSGTSEATEPVTVGDFNVDISDVTLEGSTIRVNGEVSKLGDYTSTQPVQLFVDGSKRGEKSKTIRGSSSTDVTFETQDRGSYPKDVVLRAPQSLSPQNSSSVTIEDLNIQNGPKILNVTDTFVQSGDTLEFTYTADGPNVGSVEASLINPNGDTVLSGQSLTLGSDETGTITIPSRDAIIDGGYDLRIIVNNNIDGVNVRRSDTVTGAFLVSNTINPEAIGVLGEPVTRTPAGDFATIPTGGQYMLIGGNMDSGDRQQYLDILHVSAGSTTVNTRLIGTDVPSQKAYGEGVTSYAHSIGADAGPAAREGTVFEGVSFERASSLSEFRSNIGISARSAPVQAGRYQLVAGEQGQVTVRDDGDVGFVKSVGRSNLVLTQTQRIGSIETYALPPGRASETTISDIISAPDSDTVAVGDRLAVEVPATGMWGATLPDAESEPSAEQIAQMLSKEEGIRIEFSPRDQFNDPNLGARSLQFDDVSADDVAVLADRTTDLWENETTVGDEPSIGGYYVVIDTGSTLDTEDAYMTFEMAYESPPDSSYQFESYNFGSGAQPDPFSQVTDPVDGVNHYPYFGDSDTTVRENTTVLFQEPSVQYDRVMPDGEVIVPAQPDGRVFGSTTLAPDSEVTIQVISSDRPDPEIVTIEEITIDEDRRFDVSADFSQLEPGQPATVEFYAQNRLEGNRLIDTQEVNVVDDIENPSTFEVQALPSEVTVQQRASLNEIAADIQNTGSISGREQVEFWINGESIKNETLILPSGVNETVSLSEQFVTLPVGTYPYTVRTEDDEATGQLTVEPPESGTTITETDSSSAVSSSPVGDENPSNEPGGDSSGSGLFGLVGVSGRDVALGAALTGAAHVFGYWA